MIVEMELFSLISSSLTERDARPRELLVGSMLKHSKIHCLMTENRARIRSTFNDTPHAPEAATIAKIRKIEGSWYFSMHVAEILPK